MKKMFSIVMAVCVIFAMISCDNSTSPSGGGGGGPYTVSYNANGWTGGGIPSSIKVESGAVIGAQAIIPLEESETQICLGWSLTSGQNGERVTADYKVTKNITLYALWMATIEEGQPVTITYNANGWLGQGVPTTPVTTKNSGEQIGADNLPTLEDSNGQIFYGWSVTSGQNGTRITATYSLRGNTTLYVLWTAPVTLSFDYNFEGAPANPASVEVGSGIQIGNVLPAVVDIDNPVEGQEPTRPGWLFQGWYTAREEGTRVTTSSSFTESTTVYAQWRSEPAWAYLEMDLNMLALTQGSQWNAPVNASISNGTLTWTFDGNDKRGVILFSTRQKKVLEEIDEFRLIIDGETSPADSTIPFRFFIGNQDYTADWNGTAAITQGVFASQLNNQVTFNNNKMKVEHQNDDGSTQLQEPRIQAYILQQRVAGNVSVIIKSIKLRYDQEIGGPSPDAADSKIPAYKISYNRNYEGAPIGPNPAIVSQGDTIGDYYYRGELPAITRNFYEFKGWFTAATGGTKVEATTTFNTDTPLYAQWESLPTITISYDLNYTDAPTAPADVTVVKDAAIGNSSLPTPAPRAAYFFSGWYTESTGGTKAEAASTFSTDTTLYAQWEDASSAKYTVTFNKGYVDEVHATVEVTVNSAIGAGAMPAEPTNTDPDWRFNGWFTATTGGTAFTAATVVTADRTVYAQYKYSAPLPENWMEKNTMTDTAVPIYGFKLPDGENLGMYDRITLTMKFDTDSPAKNARLRAWGNFNSAWASSSNVNNSNRPAANSWNASPGGLLLNAANEVTYTDEWKDFIVDFGNLNTLTASATIKATTGLVLLAVAPVPPGGGSGTRIYWIKNITLENSDGSKKVSALHPADSDLWEGEGTQVFLNQGGSDTLVRSWMADE